MREVTTVDPMERMNTLRSQIANLEKDHCNRCLRNQCNNCQIKAKLAAKMAELSWIFWNADYEEPAC
jgi:hypothetical protein